MKKFITFLFVAMFLLTFSTGWTQLSIEAGINGGATIPTGDYSGTMQEFYDGTKYGLSTGFNVGGYATLTTPIISARVSLNYSSLSNNGSLKDNPSHTIDLKHNIFTIGIGPQYNISIPASPIKPYAIAELLISTIGGEVTFHGLSGSGINSGSVYDIATASRIGLGITGGLSYELSIIGIDLSVKYSILNLSGKEFVSDNTNLRLSSYTNLNDGKDPLYGTDPNVHIVGNERNISTVQINLGVHLKLGI